MKKKGIFLPNWRKIVASMVIAATATIGGSYASAQDLWRSDVGGAPAAWNGTDLWADDTEGGTSYQTDSTGYDVILGTFGAGTLTTNVAGTDSANRLTVSGGGWVLDGSISIMDGLKVDTDGTLRLKASDFGNGIYKYYSIVGGTIQIDGTLAVEAGALFNNGAGAINMNGGTFSLLAGDPTLTAVNTADPIVLGSKGGTFLVDDGLEVEFRGAISLESGVTGANFTKSGDGLFVHGSRFDPTTSTVDLGTGTATYDGGRTRIESQDYKAGAMVVTGAGTDLLKAITVVTVESGNSDPVVAITGMTTVEQGGVMTIGEGLNTGASFTTGKLTVDGADANGNASKFTVGSGAKVDVVSTDADAVLVRGGGNLTIDTGADLSAFASKKFNATLDNGTMTVVNSTGTASDDAYSNANITVGADGATLEVDGDDLTLTLTADSRIGGNSGGDFTKAGTGKLVIASAEDSGVKGVDIDGQAIFNGGDVTIASDSFNSVGITANGALIIAENANVNASNVIDGDVVINKSLDMSLGNNVLSGRDLTISGINMDKSGTASSLSAYTDASDSTVTMTGTTTFGLLDLNKSTATTVNARFATEHLVLANGLSDKVNVKVDVKKYAGGASYTGGAYSELDASDSNSSLTFTRDTDYETNGKTGNVTLLNYATLKSKDLTVGGDTFLGDDASIRARDMVTAGSVTLNQNSLIAARNLTVGGEFSDWTTSTIDLGTLTNPGDPDPVYDKGDLVFNKDTTVNGYLKNVKNITAQDAATGEYKNLTLMQSAYDSTDPAPFTAISGTVASKDLTLAKDRTYGFGKLDLHGDFTDNGAVTDVTDTTASSAVIRGNATLTGSFTTPGGMHVGGTYSDKASVYDSDGNLVSIGTVVQVGGEFSFDGEMTVKTDQFSAGTLNVKAGDQLTLASEAAVAVGSKSDIRGTLILQNGATYGGNGVENFGTLIAQNGTANIAGSFVNQGTVYVGDKNSAAVAGTVLKIDGDWTSSEMKNLEFVVDSIGNIGKVEITGAATTGKGTNVHLFDESTDGVNRNKLGALVAAQATDSTEYYIIKTDSDSEIKAFTMDQTSNTNSWKFELAPVVGGDKTKTKAWQLTAYNEAVVPDVSSFFLANIMGFDLPRAQNVSGPWVRMKGGHIDDDKAQLDKMTFQMLQIGWDKSFDAVNGNGNWFAGIFMEGNWMYGKGQYSRTGYVDPVGALKSSQRGMGAGLYVSRGFENGWYVDMIGRINVYDSEVEMKSGFAHTASYRGDWADQIFSFGIEIGKTFDSKNKRFAFNPYNRVIYNSTPTNSYDLIFGDDIATPMKVRSNAVDAWTNQLGARLYWNSLNKDGRNFGNIYVGGDYYQGLSGRFAVSMVDANVLAKDKDATWQKSKLGRSKNDLSYGLGTLGTTILPRENFAVSAQADVIFGDIEGWAVTLGGRYSY